MLFCIFIFHRLLRYLKKIKNYPQLSKNLINNYSFVPKTFKQKIHIIIPFKKNVDKLIINILKQTEKVDIITIIVPEKYENKLKNGKNSLCKLLKDTCLIQISGGYGMLSKERETGTILVYVNNFSDPK